MLIKALKVLGRSLVDILRTRMEILSLDIQEARIRLVTILILALCICVVFSLALILGLFLLILIFWDINRLMAVGIMVLSLVTVGATLVGILVYKLKNGTGLLQGTINELKKDCEALGCDTSRTAK